MILTTTEFDTQIRKDSRTFRARFLRNGTPIGGEIKNITINKGACGDKFSIGSIFMPYIDSTIVECNEILENQELLLQIGLLLDDSTVEYINMGYFTVSKPEVSVNEISFTAVGRISSKMNIPPTNLPEVQSLQNLADAITATTGVAIICKGVSLNGMLEADLTGFTCREILEAITAVLGGFATEDGEGNVVISKYSTENIVEYNGDRTTSLPKFNDYDYELSGIKVIASEEWTDDEGVVHEEISYTEGTPRQTLLIQYMTESLFPVFAENIVGYTYRPGDIYLALGDPRIEPWDTISYTDIDGQTYVVPCLNIVHKFDGGVTTDVTAPGDSEASEATEIKGPLVKKVERLVTELFIAEQAILKKITAEEADLRYATIASLTATDAKIVNLSGEFLNFKNGEFQSLKASAITTTGLYAAVLNAGFMTVLDAELSFATIGSLDAAKADIKELTAKAITTDNLEAKVAEFDYITVENADIKYATIHQLEVVEEEIVDTLEANYATINSLNATNATVQTISGEFAAFKTGEFQSLQTTVADIGKAYIDTARVEELIANKGFITRLETNTLLSEYVETETLTANYITATEIDTKYATINSLSTKEAEIKNLFSNYVKAETLAADYIKAKDIDAKYATIVSLNATNASIQTLSGDFATFKNGAFHTLQANVANIESAYMDEAAVNTLVVNKGYITGLAVETLIADYVETETLEADYISAKDIESKYATIKNLEATTVEVRTLSGNHATFQTTVTNKFSAYDANISNLQATDAEIQKITSKAITTDTVDAEVAKVGYLKVETANANYATISNLNALNATINSLGTKYATIDLANVKAGSITSAMIGDGVVGTAQIADGSITDAKIVGLTANKITAGRLDAGVIEVVNLNAANITVGTINGQQIASGAIDTTKLTNSLNSTINSASTNASNALTNASNAQNAAIAASELATLNYQKVTSKGEQLIVNGNGMIGDNTNFSSWTFDGTVGNNSPGSFTRPAGSSGTLYSDEYFLVSTNNTYTFSFDVKSLLGKGTMYSFLMFYDIDKNTITAPNHMFHPGTTTTLARDLKAGDTVIYLTDASKWSTSVSYGFYLTVWNYKNSKGYTYPPESYTRNRVTLPKTSSNTLDSSKIDYTANTITLTSAYSGSTIPAGTYVSQGRDGGTYKYMPIGGTVISTDWTTYSGKMIGVDYSGTNANNKFPPGVAYARIGFLWNYNKASGEQQWITNITVTDTTVSDRAQTTADGKNTVFYQASAPSTSGRKINDVWFDTDDGNRMHYWNGSAWAAQQFSTNAIAANSITSEKIVSEAITAAKIAANTITANQIASGAISTDELAANAVTAAKIYAGAVTTDKISTGAVVADSIATNAITSDKIVAGAITTAKLDAGAVTANKILAGTITSTQLDVNEIFANTANIGKIVASQTFSDAISTHSVVVSTRSTANEAKTAAATAQECIDNLSVGGRNLLKPATNGGGNCTAGTNYNVTINTKASDTYFYINLYEGLVLGEEYTLSFKINGLADNEYYNFLVQNKSTYGAAHATNSGRAYVTFTVDSVLAGLTQILIDDSTRNLASERSISLVELKLEKGNKPTDWTPAPEDTTNRITTVSTTANSALTNANAANSVIANWCYNNNTTYIDGGSIYTGTIKAAQIDAKAITTEKIAADAVTADKINVTVLSALSANLGTVTAGVLQSQEFKDSDYENGYNNSIEGTVKTGIKIDLTNSAYYTPHIVIKDNYILLRGYMTIGRRAEGDVGLFSVSVGQGNVVSSTGLAIGDFNTVSGGASYAEGRNTTASKRNAHAEGEESTASGENSHAQGYKTIASGDYSHAEGNQAEATAIGTHAEGYKTIASGLYAHAEGYQTEASGNYSHAEGWSSHATGNCSHAEGAVSYATGQYAHTEGLGALAEGYCSHAEGWGTGALSEYQHVQGKYNIRDRNNVYAFIVGNGTSSASSNAHTLDWSGNAWYAGNITATGNIYEGGTLLSSKYAPISHSHSYIPLSGASLNDGATLKLSTYGTRTITISGNSIVADMSKETGGWAGAFSSLVTGDGNTTTLLGWYGSAANLVHIFMGGTYSDPAMKMTPAGIFTFKNTPYVGSTKVSLEGHTHDYLPKTTYEYNKELALGGSGAICIGKFSMYDSNITVEISSTTSTTYNGTLVIATQNYGTSGGGSFTANVYGDVSNTIAPNIYIYNVGTSGVVEVYFKPSTYSKNLMHVQCQALRATPTEVLTSITSVPTTATTKPTNLLKSALDGKANSSHTHSYLPLSGGQMTGPLSFSGEAALPSKSLQYVCGIDAFASGGQMGWQSKADFLSGYLTSSTAASTYAPKSHTHSEYASASHSHTLDYRLQAAQSAATGSDANSATATGFHYINGTTNRPSFNQNNGVTGNDYRILTTAYSASWLQQIATDFRCDDIFYRRNQNGSWQSWRRIAFADECAAASHSHSYLPLSGGTLTGILNLTSNIAQINFRPGHTNYDGVISYQTSGNEAMVFSTKNAVTSFMFVNGEDTITNISEARWQSLTPGLQIKNNRVAIGKQIANGVTPTYTLDVGGTIYASGTIYEGGTALSSKYAPANRICSGSIASTSVAANSYTDVSVTFPFTFSSAPNVVVGLNSTSTAGALGSISVAVTSRTTTGCTIRFFNAGSASRSPAAYWIAHIN